MGLLGVYITAFLIYGHLANLRPLGSPYLQPVAPLVLEDWKDTLSRFPSNYMKKRSKLYSNRNLRRQNQK